MTLTASAKFCCCLLGKGIWARSVRSPVRGGLVVLGGCMRSKQRQDSLRAGDKKAERCTKLDTHRMNVNLQFQALMHLLLLCSTFLDL